MKHLYVSQSNVFRNIVVGSLVIMLISCNAERDSFLAKDIHFFSNFPEVDTVTFNNLFKHQYSNIDRLILKDSLLITKNNNGRSRQGYEFTTYNLSTFEYCSFFPFGKGPCEILGVVGCGFLDDRFWINDITSRKFLSVKLKDIIPGKSEHKENCVSLSLNKGNVATLGDGLLVNDTTFICKLVNSESKKKLAKVKLPSCEIIEEYGGFNQDYDNTMFLLNREAHMDRSIVFIKPDDNNIMAIAYCLTDQFEIFDLENNESNVFWGPHKIKNEFVVNKNTLNPYPQINDKTQLTYVAGFATEKYLYLIYSGIYLKKNLIPDGVSLGSKSIYVFDWTGKPIKKIVWREDIPIRAIAISEKENVLYGYDEYSNYIVTAKLE